jgi:cyclophilin family peptidyl-prolyl cis-trans isomerase
MSRTLIVAVTLLLAAGPLPGASAEGGSAKPRALIKTSHGDITVELWPEVAPKTVESFLALADGKGAMVDNRTGKTVEIRKPFYDGLTFHRVIKGFMLQGGCPKGNGTGDAGYWFDDELNAKVLGLDKQMVIANNRVHPWVQGMGPAYWQQQVLIPVFKLVGVSPTDRAEQQRRQPEIVKKLQSMTLKALYELQGYKYSDTLPSKPPKTFSLAMANSGPNTNGSQFFINLGETPHLTGRHTVFGHVVAGQDVAKKIGDVKVGPGAKPVKPVTIISIRSIK